MNENFRSNIVESARTAEDFTKLYYESLDKKRHQISRWYLDNGIAVWNGNDITGKENIQKFFEGLPATEHTVVTVDAQPVIDDAVSSQKTLLIIVSGSIRYNNSSKPFQQTFMVTAQGDKWKIVSDCLRLQSP